MIQRQYTYAHACTPSRNGRLLALVQFEKNDFKAFIVEQPFTYYILVGVHNLPFLLRVHTRFVILAYKFFVAWQLIQALIVLEQYYAYALL